MKHKVHKLNKPKADQTYTKPKFLYKNLGYKIVGAFYNVRNTYGNGQKELVYQNALAEELDSLNISYKREQPISINSVRTQKTLGLYKLDFIVEGKIIIEVKAIKFTPSKIEQQLYSYLQSTPYKVGYLVNFGSTNLFFKRVILTKVHE